MSYSVGLRYMTAVVLRSVVLGEYMSGIPLSVYGVHRVANMRGTAKDAFYSVYSVSMTCMRGWGWGSLVTNTLRAPHAD